MRIHTFMSEQKHPNLARHNPAGSPGCCNPLLVVPRGEQPAGQGCLLGPAGLLALGPSCAHPFAHIQHPPRAVQRAGSHHPVLGAHRPVQDVPGAASPLCQELSEQNTEILSIRKESSLLPPFLDSSCDKHATIPPASPRACALPAEPH